MEGAAGIHDGRVVGVSSSVRVATRGGKECGLTKEKRKMRRAEEEAGRKRKEIQFLAQRRRKEILQRKPRSLPAMIYEEVSF